MPDTSSISTPALDKLSYQNRNADNPVTAKNELGKDAFLQLLVTQLSNQDPLSPQDSGDFIAQLAQFSSVEGIQSLNTSFEDLSGSLRSNQALQASALVGRSVRIPAETAPLSSEGSISGSLTLPTTAQRVDIRIFDLSGQLVGREQISNGLSGDKTAGVIQAGDIPFQWSGKMLDGSRAAPGTYRIEAEATVAGAGVRLQTNMNSNVDSVTLDQGSDVILNVAGVGPVSLSSVKEIY